MLWELCPQRISVYFRCLRIASIGSFLFLTVLVAVCSSPYEQSCFLGGSVTLMLKGLHLGLYKCTIPLNFCNERQGMCLQLRCICKNFCS